MTDSHNSVRLPPDSTGKRVPHKAKWIVNYDNGVYAIEDGDNVAFQTSQLTGTVNDVEGSVASGWFGVILDEHAVGTPIDGENILINGITHATVNGTPTEQYFYPVSIIASGTAPEQHAEVDTYGSLRIRARGGDFQLGPTGRLKTGGELTLGEYQFSDFGLLQLIVSQSTAGAGAVAFDPVYGAAKLSVTTAIGDLTQLRTDPYHIVQPNFPVTASTLIQIGDTGKDGLKRRWGLFDEDNGFFFELEGSTLYAVYRSNNTGVAVDTRIAQADWNQDRVDGGGGVFNRSGVDLDVTKINYYWVGASPSAGTVHYGIRTNRGTIICHEVQWTNILTRPVVKNFSLPLTWNMDTIDSTAALASGSEMYISYGVVTTDSERFDIRPNASSIEVVEKLIDTNWVPIISARAKMLDIFGSPNRAWIIPQSFSMYSDTTPVLYRAVYTNILLGDMWADGQPTSLMEFDTDATASVGGIITFSGIIPAGDVGGYIIMESTDFTPQQLKITRKADITATPLHFSLVVRALSGTTKVSVTYVTMEVT